MDHQTQVDDREDTDHQQSKHQRQFDSDYAALTYGCLKTFGKKCYSLVSLRINVCPTRVISRSLNIESVRTV